MAGYRFYSRADVEQDRIWQHTLDEWGEAQAVAYITGLHAHLTLLCETRALWRRLPANLVVPADVRKTVFLSRYERHYIFFRELGNGDIGVMSLLHDRMNIPVRLAEDLAILAARSGEPDTEISQPPAYRSPAPDPDNPLPDAAVPVVGLCRTIFP